MKEVKLLIKEELRKMHNLINEQNYVFSVPHISIDGKYIIYEDELYDYTINENLGSIFDVENLKNTIKNFDIKLLNENFTLYNNVKTILETINEKTIVLEIKNSIKNKVLLEDENSVGGTILNWVLWFARKVKGLLWSVGGMAVDTFLVASGIGKTVQWVPWAICLGLDVYQWTSGDYGDDPNNEKNTSPIWKALTIGFDILGMTTAGPFAKAAKRLFKPIQTIKSEVKIAEWVSKSPKAIGVIKKIQSGLNSVPSMMKQLITMFAKKAPKLSKWLSGLLSGIMKTISWIANILGKILKAPGKTAERIGNAVQGKKLVGKEIGKGLKSATNVSLIGGAVTSLSTNNTNDNNIENIFANKDIEFDYDDI